MCLVLRLLPAGFSLIDDTRSLVLGLRGLVLSLRLQLLAVRLGFRLCGLSLVFDARLVRSGVALGVVLLALSETN